MYEGATIPYRWNMISVCIVLSSFPGKPEYGFSTSHGKRVSQIEIIFYNAISLILKGLS